RSLAAASSQGAPPDGLPLHQSVNRPAGVLSTQRLCLGIAFIAPEEMQMSVTRLKHFGWGREGEGLTAEEEAFVMARAQARFGTALKESASAPRLEDIRLEPPRVAAPGSLPFCTSEHYDRVAHAYGKSYPELARGLARDYASAPDVVAYPRNE